jgi:hypothetical protein
MPVRQVPHEVAFPRERLPVRTNIEAMFAGEMFEAGGPVGGAGERVAAAEAEVGGGGAVDWREEAEGGVVGEELDLGERGANPGFHRRVVDLEVAGGGLGVGEEDVAVVAVELCLGSTGPAGRGLSVAGG